MAHLIGSMDQMLYYYTHPNHMSKIKVRVKQENINEAKVSFECKPEDAFKIIESIAEGSGVCVELWKELFRDYEGIGD